MTITGSAIGAGATVHNVPGRSVRPCDIGIITIKANESRAVGDVLGLVLRPGPGPGHVDAGTLHIAGRPVRLVATRALEQGQRSTMAAIGRLRQHDDPAVIVLVGIGGGIDPVLELGDVVIATRVVYYDLRRELPGTTRRRGEARDTSAEIGHAANRFFTDHGEPAEFTPFTHPSAAHSFRVWPGPIGTGEAVISDRGSAVRTYLKEFNEKILAIDTEAGAISQYWHENAVPGGRLRGWLVVRGISDHAANMTYEHQTTAARHAAIALRALVPYLAST
jgi:adenosylhomocysteine nucleosidase